MDADQRIGMGILGGSGVRLPRRVALPAASRESAKGDQMGSVSVALPRSAHPPLSHSSRLGRRDLASEQVPRTPLRQECWGQRRTTRPKFRVSSDAVGRWGKGHIVVLQPISVTLYDIFGYLVPGAMTLLAIVIAAWTATTPRTTLQLIPQSAQLWVAAALVAYVAGHVVQAIANLLARCIPSPERVVLAGRGVATIPKCLADAVRERLGARLGVPGDGLPPECVYALCDETVVQRGVTDDRQMYVYREGFYRGMAVAFLLLSLSIIARAFVPGGAVKVGSTMQPMAWGLWALLAALSAAATYFMFARYQRFAAYRVTRAILGFLALEGKQGG
jgi:hypothetical protein